MKEIQNSAKSVEEAIQLALEELGARREEVEVDVLSEGKHGILGVGSEEAMVSVRLLEGTEAGPEPAKASPEPAKAGPEPAGESDAISTTQDVLEAILSRMEITASAEHQAEAFIQESERTPAPIVFNIEGEELGILIGRRGQTLACLQYIVRLIVAHKLQASVLIVIDVNGYKQRRYQSLRDLAERMAEGVAASGNPFILEPMSAYERRIIHVALANYPGVTTQSTGIADARKVVILPREQ